MNKRFYLAVMVCVAIAVATHILGSTIADWMASSAPHPELQKRLVTSYHESIFSPLSRPAQPLPLLLELVIKYQRQIGPYLIISTILFGLQVLFLLRRIAICALSRSVQPPRSLNRGWKAVLWFSLASWLLGATLVLLSRLFIPLFGGVQGLAFALAVVQAFVIPFAWLISSNFFGFTFFLVEALSIVKEGVLPRPNTAVNTDAAR